MGFNKTTYENEVSVAFHLFFFFFFMWPLEKFKLSTGLAFVVRIVFLLLSLVHCVPGDWHSVKSE